MGIGDNQLHSAESPGGERTQEGQPESAVLAGSHVDAQDLPLALSVDRRRHHHTDVDDASRLPDLLDQSAPPQVGFETVGFTGYNSL